jgi:hypothetical protein
MIIQDDTPRMLWSPGTVPGDASHELPDRAPNDLEKEDRWVSDFIERLHYAIEDIGRKKQSEAASAGPPV